MQPLHSCFSLRYGVRTVADLVAAAREKGLRTLVLTDINNTSATLDFYQNCIKNDIKPIIGIEFRRDGKLLFTGIARNRDGWFQLCKLLTEHTAADGRQNTLPAVPPPLPDCFIVYEKLPKPINLFEKNEFLGIRPATARTLMAQAEAPPTPPEGGSQDTRDCRGVVLPPSGGAEGAKHVAWNPVTFLEPDDPRTHKLLRAIDQNALVTKLTEADLERPDSFFLDEKSFADAFQRHPKMLENALFLEKNCEISFETGLQLNRQTFTGSKTGDFRLVAKLAENGLARRYGIANKTARERVMRELKVIQELDFCAYFLITWDIVRYAQSAGFHHVGRGSGANSIVAFCLFITDVDPLELDLYFERFINPHRASPPDFDIDFSWDERDDVTNYIFDRYGRDHVALLATYSTFQPAAAVREIGKAIGLPKAEIDGICDNLPTLLGNAGDWRWGGRNAEFEPQKVVGGDANNGPKQVEDLPTVRFGSQTLTSEAKTPLIHHSSFIVHHLKEILRFVEKLQDLPNYLSIHAGGVLVSEEPLNCHTALQMMPKGFPVTHFDMYAAEEWGFHKLDILSQRGLGHIKDAVDLIKKNRRQSIDVHDIERIKNDPAVREQLRSAHCIGCFYIESPAMRGLLSKLRCDDYVHLVAASSIIRPGVAQSGMMREYITRFHSPNGFKYLHPVFEKHLGETYGVMVYQEDVMKIVHHFAGLDLDESDILRRMMTGKKRSSEAFARLQKKYFDNCRDRGYPDELTNEVWRQIESFAGYSFCKAHSASFAVESFQSLFLKTYFPKEFMVAVINNFGGFYSTEFYVHELRRAGAKVHPPCVNNSLYLTTITGDDAWLGFVHLKGFEQKMACEIVENRQKHGLFRGLDDFLRRIAIGPEQVQLLIRIGALRFTGLDKCALMWEKNRLLGSSRAIGTGLLFEDEPAENYHLPVFESGEFDQAFDEMELLGFPLRSPFDLMQNAECRMQNGATAQAVVGVPANNSSHVPANNFTRIFSKNLRENIGKAVEIIGYYVARKDIRTKTGKPMHFGTWLDAEGFFFDTTHFPDYGGRSRGLGTDGGRDNWAFRGKGLYKIWGRVTLDFGFPSIEVAGMERLAYRADGRNG